MYVPCPPAADAVDAGPEPREGICVTPVVEARTPGVDRRLISSAA
jgi:hypothetical protein